MQKPKVCVLRTAGTNCDQETAFAFFKAGAFAELVHTNSLVSGYKALDEYQILAIPGGFTYGDDVAAGKILANELKYELKAALLDFIGEGKLIIGICNGFQMLVKSGLLPGNAELAQEASLTINDSAKFEDRWVYLKCIATGRQKAKCVWTKGLPEIIYLPVAHGEGKFVVRDKAVLARLKRNNQIVVEYCDEKGSPASYPHNPNGSTEGIAGICDETGRVFGLMPHPERHIHVLQHPRWVRSHKRLEGVGLAIFKNAVVYVQKKF
ncbi:MAG: phosphoribosylformylglycinamidine synthase I [Candidatus Omnitrophota bacterium]|jgi:phosphoribosylformylglycinamidine synthase|nr:MAG: phosphoribosylformylglycinamidine synthase I [Candidatus Omnitrophota bacterium]